MDYTILSNEISQPQYAGMDDAAITATLNAPGASTRRRVPISELQARSMETGVYTALRVASSSPDAPAELRAVAQTVLDLASARFDDVDLDNAASRQMFGALQQAGVISAQQAAQIDALATVPGMSRAQELSLGDVAEGDIQAARGWLAAQEAEQARLAAFAALRERLINGHLGALAWLQAQLDGGQNAPQWADILTRL